MGQSQLVVIPTEDAVLSRDEQQALAFYETRMEQAAQQYEVASLVFATSLRTIREQKLYKTYGTFEDYCRERWQKHSRWGQQLIAAAKVIENLRDSAHLLPATETQARPLTRLQPDLQREAWARAVETAPEGKITAAHVAKVVQEVAPEVMRPKSQSLTVHYSSVTPEWYTPQHIIERVLDVLGTIDLDPCSNSKTQPNVPAKCHYTLEDDGLRQPWFNYVYMNPPYGDEVGRWVERLVYAYTTREIALAIALLPARTDTAWFQPLWQYPICFVRGRLKFSGSEHSAPFPSVVVYLGDMCESFEAAFQDIGHVSVPKHMVVA